MKIGTTAEQRKNLESNNFLEKQYNFQTGSNVLRFIQGPVKCLTIWLPSLVEKEENGVKKPTVTPIAYNMKDDTGIFQSLYEAEMKLYAAFGEKKPEYAFRPKINWWYLAIPKTGGILDVVPVKVPKTVKDGLVEMESKLSLTNQSLLMNGLYFMYDVNVEKKVNPAKPKRFGTEYSVAIYGNNPYFEQVEAEYLRNPGGIFDPELGGLTFEDLFGKDIADLIENNDLDLDKEIKFLSPTEIIERLNAFPICINGTNLEGQPYFPQVDSFLNEMKRTMDNLGVPYVELNASVPSMSKGNAPQETSGGIKKLGQFKKQEGTVEESNDTETADGATDVEEAKVVEEAAKPEAAKPEAAKSPISKPNAAKLAALIKKN